MPPEQPYGPGAICDDCGHFACSHSETGCGGAGGTGGCKFGGQGTHRKRGKCKGMLWQGRRWPRPWLPAPEGLTR